LAFHFIQHLLPGNSTISACQGDFKGAKWDHFAFAMVKADELGVILAFFDPAAGVKRLFIIGRRHPAAFFIIKVIANF
jgi:hypothetical protein